ncbi:MAG TPA: hypothetical protein VJB38_06720 [Bacteroidota bacterium]|nr:hypothetical protein [Bacteroidota bacterium]
MYEPRHQRPIPRRHFVRRLLSHLLASMALIVVSLFLGMLGYHHYEQLPWRDAFLNAAMLLGGMGPLSSRKQTAANCLPASMLFIPGWFFLSP